MFRPDLMGWLSEAEWEELQRLASGLTVLEVGAWKGRSTVALLEVAEAVVTVDHWRGDSFTGRTDQATLFGEWLANVVPICSPRFLYVDGQVDLATLEKIEAVEPSATWSMRHRLSAVVADLADLIGDNTIAMIPQNRLFDLAFYDADHSGGWTAKALAWLDQLLKPGGVIACHDYDTRQPQYREAVASVDEFAEATGRTLTVVDTLAVLC